MHMIQVIQIYRTKNKGNKRRKKGEKRRKHNEWKPDKNHNFLD